MGKEDVPEIETSLSRPADNKENIDEEKIKQRIADLKEKLNRTVRRDGYRLERSYLQEYLDKYKGKKRSDGKSIVEAILEGDYVEEFKDLPRDVFIDIMTDEFQELYATGPWFGPLNKKNIDWFVELSKAIDKETTEQTIRTMLIKVVISRMEAQDFRGVKTLMEQIGEISPEEGNFISEKLSDHFVFISKSTEPLTLELYQASTLPDEIICNSVKLAIEKLKHNKHTRYINYGSEEGRTKAIQTLKEWFRL